MFLGRSSGKVSSVVCRVFALQGEVVVFYFGRSMVPKTRRTGHKICYASTRC